jgi:hypothetical protein
VSTEQGFYLQPQIVITFDLSVPFTQETATPGEPVTDRSLAFVLPTEITNDFCMCRIGGYDCSPTTNQAMCLVEICRFPDVGR